jgi:hypothetical protein
MILIKRVSKIGIIDAFNEGISCCARNEEVLKEGISHFPAVVRNDSGMLDGGGERAVASPPPFPL